MTVLDLTKALKKYKKGWVAINEKEKKVIAHAIDFKSITEKVAHKKGIVLMPASDDYYGFIT